MKTHPQITKFLRYSVWAFAILAVLSSLLVMFARFRYPFELEGLEGRSLIQVQRILNGEGIYVAPSIDFVPYIHPPLYFYLSALVARIVGVQFAALRLVSLAATVGTFLLTFLIVQRETASRTAAMLSVGLFAATFEIGGAWFDIGRVDSLFLFWLMLGIYLLGNLSYRYTFAASICFVLAFLTKVTALFVFLPIAVLVLWQHWRRGLWFIVPFILLVASSSIHFTAITNGWYQFYVLNVLGRHSTGISWDVLWFWVRDLTRPLTVALAITAVYFTAGNHQTKRLLFFLVIAMGMLGVSWAGRLNPGGYNNVLLPAYAVMALLFGLGFHEIQQRLQQSNLHSLQPYLYLACLLQFVSLLYLPFNYIPTAADQAAGWDVVDTIRQIDGDVFAPYQPYLLLMAGKKPLVHRVAACELNGCWGGQETTEGTTIFSEIEQAIQSQQYAAILLPDENWLKDTIGVYYAPQDIAFENDRVFRPVTGLQLRPDILYVPILRSNHE